MLFIFLALLILLRLAPGGRQALQPVTYRPGDERPRSAAQRVEPGQAWSSTQAHGLALALASGLERQRQPLALVLYIFFVLFILAKSWPWIFSQAKVKTLAKLDFKLVS